MTDAEFLNWLADQAYIDLDIQPLPGDVCDRLQLIATKIKMGWEIYGRTTAPPVSCNLYNKALTLRKNTRCRP